MTVNTSLGLFPFLQLSSVRLQRAVVVARSRRCSRSRDAMQAGDEIAKRRKINKRAPPPQNRFRDMKRKRERERDREKGRLARESHSRIPAVSVNGAVARVAFAIGGALRSRLASFRPDQRQPGRRNPGNIYCNRLRKRAQIAFAPDTRVRYLGTSRREKERGWCYFDSN